MADSNKQSTVEAALKAIQVLSVVAGVVISVLSSSHSQRMDAEARKAEADARTLELQKYEDKKRRAAETRSIEAAKSFPAIRLEKYMEAIKAAGILANPEYHGGSRI